jgi:hypothetical protein
METWGSGGIAPPFLTSALDGGEWSASRPGRFTPKKKVTGGHWIGGWVGPRAVLDAVEKKKISCSCRERIPGRPARSQSLYLLSYPSSLLCTGTPRYTLVRKMRFRFNVIN